MNTLACTQTKASIRDLRETGECNLFFECKNVVRKPSSTNPHKAKQRKWCTVDPYVWTMGGRLEAGWRRSCKDLHLFGQTGGRLEAGWRAFTYGVAPFCSRRRQISAKRRARLARATVCARARVQGCARPSPVANMPLAPVIV